MHDRFDRWGGGVQIVNMIGPLCGVREEGKPVWLQT